MGVASLSDHVKYKKDKRKEHGFNNPKSPLPSFCFRRSSPSSTLSSSSQSSQVQSTVANNTLDIMILPISILKTEIKWSMEEF